MIKTLVDKIADRTRWGYLAAFGILLISYIISYVSTQNLMKQSNLVNHSNEVIHGLDNIVGFVTQCESAARGYIITNRKVLLTKYLKSRNNADSAIKNVKFLTSDNHEQQMNMDSLNALVQDKFSLLEKVLSVFDSTHTITNAILNTRSQGIAKMDKIENYVHYVQNEERKLSHERSDRLAKYSNIIKGFTIISLLVAILLTFYSIITFNKENKAKREASQKAASYRQQLEMRIDELASTQTSN